MLTILCRHIDVKDTKLTTMTRLSCKLVSVRNGWSLIVRIDIAALASLMESVGLGVVMR